MKKQIILLSAIIFSILFVNFVMADLEYWQTKENHGNGTIYNRMVLIYSKNGFGVANDYITGNNPLQTYIQYDMYVQSFNTLNPNFKVDYCNFKIEQVKRLENVFTTIFEKNYTQSDTDIFKAQYFLQLYDGDSVFATQTCYYQDKTISELTLPAEMIMVMPTSECKACQYYLWTKQEADITKTKSIGDNISNISRYIGKLVNLNFEIILALFWILLIMFIFIGIGLIFVLIYWVYLYLNNMVK